MKHYLRLLALKVGLTLIAGGILFCMFSVPLWYILEWHFKEDGVVFFSGFWILVFIVSLFTGPGLNDLDDLV